MNSFFMSPWTSPLLSVLRIVSAYLFLLHGTPSCSRCRMWRCSTTCRSSR